MAFVYKDRNTKEISFPLGGIGTGCIGLAGSGRLIDWEIFNKPNKGTINSFTHFAVKAEKDGKLLDARVLNGNFLPPYTGGETTGASFNGFGFGTQRATMAGVPHFKDVVFKGEYPFAELNFIDEMFPGRIILAAFNPFIPLNDKDSSIPGGFFEIEIENTSHERIDYSACLSLNNMLPQGTAVNTYQKSGNIHFINLTSSILKSDDKEYGDLAAAVYADDVSYQEYWYRGAWFDNLGVFWRDFTKPGRFTNRSYPYPEKTVQKVYNGDDMCSLAAHFSIEPGEKKNVRFVITWNFPNCHNYWNPEKTCCCSGDCGAGSIRTWKNYYATIFQNSLESARYALEKWDELYNDTLKFKNALFSSTLPEYALDAVSANISILKTPTCLRLEDGSFYGWEGCSCSSGCCEGSCTHVWNYAYALPFLFPKLERSMRDLDYKYNQRDDGGMSFRLQLPLGRERSAFRPCADGQFGGVIKAYRDWKISGDTSWLKSNWDAIKKSIEFAWSETNGDRWDHDRDGVLEGRQHHTLDMELFGPNSWLNGFYLAALKAGAEMAEFLGEKEKASEYEELFKKGKAWVDSNLFNGEYYGQLIDINDISIFQEYGSDAVNAYWNDEAREIKYQIGDGCAVDQVLAQWHANLCGLGEIFDNSQVKKALQSIYKNNFKKNMRNFFNACRLYSLNDEAGVIICDWPEGRRKPVVPLTYAEETMNGFEYQSAIHMIQEGFVDEGFEIVKAIRQRYDGEKRNPWNEFECGSNYARSMASYALIPSVSGFKYNMVEGNIGFNPIQPCKDNFKSFWSLDSGWGTFSKINNTVIIQVLYGRLDLHAINLEFWKYNIVKDIYLGNQKVDFTKIDGDINFKNKVVIEKDCSITIEAM